MRPRGKMIWSSGMTVLLASYCGARRIHPLRRLGEGKDGVVYETTRPSAVKGHVLDEPYRRERDAYLRMRDRQMTKCCGGLESLR